MSSFALAISSWRSTKRWIFLLGVFGRLVTSSLSRGWACADRRAFTWRRARHGRTQAEKDRELAERKRATRLLEGKRLESPGDGSAGVADADDDG